MCVLKFHDVLRSLASKEKPLIGPIVIEDRWSKRTTKIDITEIKKFPFLEQK